MGWTQVGTFPDGKRKNNGSVDLTSSADAVAYYRVIDDGTSTAGWPDRLRFTYVPPAGQPSGWNFERTITWVNEYGELRVSAARPNTVALRVFAADTPGGFVNKDKSVSVWEAVSDRTDRTNLAKVDGFGDLTVARDVLARNVDSRVTAYPSGSVPADNSPELLALPNRTVILEYA